jgi:RNA polymerase subunit RPABC4/transcription elongation factor Spt4
MDQILDAFGESIGAFFEDPTIQLALRAIAIYIVLIWLAAAYWAYRDLQARTTNPIAPYLAAAMIILFTPLLFLFGVILYRIIRPSETVAEANERALAEEAMLVEVESQPHCANCARRVHADWIICPTCRNRLRRVCPNCSRLVELDWSLCAWCGKDFERPEALREVLAPAPRRRLAPSEATTAVPALARTSTSALRTAPELAAAGELSGRASGAEEARTPQDRLSGRSVEEPARTSSEPARSSGYTRRVSELNRAAEPNTGSVGGRRSRDGASSSEGRPQMPGSIEPLPADASNTGRASRRR